MADVMPRMAGGNQNRRDGRLRVPVPVGRPVQQLSGPDSLRDQTEETEFDVARAQDGAGFRMVEAGGWLVERIRGR